MRQTRRMVLSLVVAVAIMAIGLAPAAGQTAVMGVKNNRVGVGDSATNPLQLLHVKASDGTARLFVHEAKAAFGESVLMELKNNGPARFTISSAAGGSWSFKTSGVGLSNFDISKDGTGVAEFRMADNGDLTLTGDIFTSSCSPCVSDYVFEEGYELLPLSEVEAFIAANGHLPNVPSEADYQKQGRVGLHDLQKKLLEKIEELTLYTIDQQKTIDSLTARLEELEKR